MALTGTHLRTLDEKNRIAIPRRLREHFGESAFVAPGTESSLALYSPAEFERLARRLAEKSSSRIEFRNYLRLFYARAEQVPLDGQGRILIPERLIEFARLKRDVVLLGVHDHAELWDKDLWEHFLAEHQARFDEMATHALE